MPTISSRFACVAVSCAAGAIIGLLYLPEPRALDGALVLAGIVNYPPDSAQGIYFHNVWTAIHQILAFFLWIGFGQSLVTYAFCASLGASFVAGLTLVTLALTEKAILSLGVALLVVVCSFFVQGIDYPILFISSHSFGQIASSLTILGLGLFGNRKYASVGFVAGILPAFHPVVGSWTVGIVVIGSVLLRGQFRGDTPRLLKGLALGAIVSALSFIYFWVHRVPVAPAVDAAAFNDFLQYWDYHRQVPYTSRTALLTSIALVLLLIIFENGRRLRKPALVQMSFLLMIGALGSLMVYEVVHRFHDHLPSVVNSAMLGRLVNIQYVLALPILAGALYARQNVVLLVLAVPLIRAFYVTRNVQVLLVWCVILAALYLTIRYLINRTTKTVATPGENRFANRSVAFVLIGIGMAFAGSSLFALSTRPIPECNNTFIDDCRAPEVFQEMSRMEWKGLTAAPAGLAMMVHRHAHKAVLLGASGFDFIPYLPQTAAQVRDIVESVYGVDYRNPPSAFRNKGNVMQEMGREHWEKLSSADWENLANNFCVGAIIAPSDWAIRLVPSMERNDVKLYLLSDRNLEECRIP